MRLTLARPLLLLAALAAGCARHQPRIVVWIEIDTLRADALGCYGNHSTGAGGVLPSPHIDALAADGLRFEHAYSTAPATIPSLSSQLSGQWPWELDSGRPQEPAPADSIALVPRLRELGWRSAGVTSDPSVSRKQGFGAGFERWDDTLALDGERSRSPEALARLLAFADELARDPGQGLLLFGWLSEPRYPYEEHAGLQFGPPYDGPLKFDEPLGELLARRAQLTEADRLGLRGRYQGEVAFVDRALGAFLDELKRRDWYDEALIVFASDHGEELFERGALGHGPTLFEEVVHVPWIVKLPASEARDRRGRSLPDVVSLIDLPATLLDWSGARPRTPGGGLLGHSRSLLALLRTGAPSERVWIYLHSDFELPLPNALTQEKRAQVWGVIDAESALKWIVDHGPNPPRGVLYDLKHDPFETNDVAARMGPGRAAPLQRLRALVPRPLAGARAAPAVLPDEPWIARPADLDGAGPALLAEQR